MKEANKDQMGILQSSEELDKKMKEMETRIRQEAVQKEKELEEARIKLDEERQA